MASIVTIHAPDTGTTGFGSGMASAGDVDRDGFGDLIIGAPGEARNGRAFVYRGGASGIAVSPTTTYDGTTFQYGDFGWQVCGATN